MFCTHSVSRAIAITVGIGASSWSATRIAGALQELVTDLLDPYRPELYYMRGPGPKWREKHACDGPVLWECADEGMAERRAPQHENVIRSAGARRNW
ncbi:MAG: hypothetical protein E5X43_04455 [Mesorhizobium sp.]|nr:hypothetical protein EOA85_21760 [Mesorhizobium sp. M5C.F.Ca.IN.020.29.1.1]RWH81322.1 MAG: hypothetical protein EOQ85_09870 [Mesorhizobium sp.]RWH85705.1 MAG: hypothetical protein EOQ86_05920 [Mesorhizobium sp.]RWH90962.1 MAG: hypothetical protein EOQ87_09575 [Mesorhizobium sp.]RWH99644.1 MAG: hypothetical protein EOQ88_09680 [Mesorhizobium sp.]